MSNTKQWDDLSPELRVHLKKIQIALSEGRAAAMIGAGFSRNASNGHRMPSWTELGRKMTPDNANVNAAEVPRLAELYKALHGGEALNLLLKDNIPDRGITKPDFLHRNLLRLNWNDIFTTNYDTLLERAYFEDQDNGNPTIQGRYHIVHTVHDIPAARGYSRHRIVKLHGSFPSHEPFIVTEEDYRTYPQRFAPFVNTVRQSMLENVFCLLGFSGDDPNFLAWIGWVRDQLVDLQPRIYLITLGDLPLGQRELLQSRNITCLNIRELDDSEPADYKQCYTVLLNLLDEKCPAPQEWQYVPHDLWLSRLPGTSSEESHAKLLRAMRTARRMYPGWVFPPLDCVKYLWNFGEQHRTLFNKRACPKGTTPKLAAMLELREILWLSWSAGLPCSSQFICRSIALLTLCLPILLRAEHSTLARNDSWAEEELSNAEIMEAWQESACVLLSFCRRGWLKKPFTRCCTLLLRIPKRYLRPDTSNWMAYQSILLHLESLDLERANTELKEWTPVSNESPFWIVRRAMLGAELGYGAQAQFQLFNALQSIRQQIQIDGETPELLSQEQWADHYYKIFINSPIVTAKILNPTEMNEAEANTPSVAEERSRRVRGMPWHPRTILAALQDAIFGAFNTPVSTTSIEFDLGSRTRQIKLQNGYLPGVSCCLSLLSLIERAAFVPRIDDRRLELRSELSTKAATLLFQLMRGFSTDCLRLALRTASTKFMKPECPVFSRAALAMLDTDTVFDLAEKCHSWLENYIASFSSTKNNQGCYQGAPLVLSFALELLGRLTVRIPKETYQRLLDSTIAWYTAPAFTCGHTLYDEFGTFFKRVVKDAPFTLLANVLERLLLLPVITDSQRGFRRIFLEKWIDPAEALPLNWPAERRSLLPAIDDALIQHLLEALTQETQQPENELPIIRSWRRLAWLQDNDLLSGEMQEKIWEFLQETASDGSWAKIPGCNPWVSLLLAPKEKSDDTWQRYRTFVLQELSKKPAVDTLYSLFCLTPEVSHERLEGDDELLNALLNSLKNFISSPLPPPRQDPFGMYQRESYQWSDLIWLLCYICGKHVAANKAAYPWLPEYLRNLQQTCRNRDIPHLRLELLLAALGSADTEKFVRCIERALFSSDDNVVYEAGITLLAWHGYFPDLTPLPQLELIAKTFEFRRPFHQKLCKLLVERQSYVGEHFSNAELDYILTALEHYAGELSYDSAYVTRSQRGIIEQAPPFPFELPENRYQCAKLVAILWRDPEIRNHPTVQRWVEEMKNDPLAELRNIAETLNEPD